MGFWVYVSAAYALNSDTGEKLEHMSSVLRDSEGSRHESTQQGSYKFAMLAVPEKV